VIPLNTYPINPLAFGQPNTNPYYTPMQNVIPNYPVVQQTAPHMDIQRVNGKDSAYAYNIGPNSSVILVDNLQPKIWVVTTDASGYKAVKGFTITPDEEDNTPIPAEGKVDPNEDLIRDLTERLNKLEEKVKDYEQSNSKPAYQSKSGNGNVQSNDRNGTSGKGSNRNA
jgi:hypothetical protein